MITFYHIIVTKTDPYSSGEYHVKSLFGTDKTVVIAETMKQLKDIVFQSLTYNLEQTKNSNKFRGIKYDENEIVGEVDVDAELQQVTDELCKPIARWPQCGYPPALIGQASTCWHEVYLYELAHKAD